MTRHYHAPSDHEREQVYVRKSDADDCLADTLARANRSETDFRPDQVRDFRVRACTDHACMGD